MLVTPPLETRGRFTLKPPFVAATTKVYTVISLRHFKEMIASSVDILNKFYIPNGLKQEDYERDVKDNATLVIIYAEDGEMLFVPNSYIQSFPSQSIPPYANYVISAQLGAFRTDYDFSFCKQKVAEVLSDTIGVEVPIQIDSIGEAQVMSVDDADVLETNRAEAIKDRQTSYAKLLEAETTIINLQETIKALEEAYQNK